VGVIVELEIGQQGILGRVRPRRVHSSA
jgi:hypothetical protein